MGKPHPIELRERVVAFVNEGNSNREAARHFRVSPRFVNNMMILHRSSGSLRPARQGHLPYSPDLNPIEMAFSKLKALLRKRAARSFDAIAQALGDIISLFSVDECRNFFKAAGYEAE